MWVSDDPGPAGRGAGGPWVPHPPLRSQARLHPMNLAPSRRGVIVQGNSPGPGEPAGRSTGQRWLRVGIPTWAFYDNANELVDVLRKSGEREWADCVERFSRSSILKRDYFCAGYIVYLDADDRVRNIEAILLTGAFTPRPIIEVVDIRNWHTVRIVNLNKT